MNRLLTSSSRIQRVARWFLLSALSSLLCQPLFVNGASPTLKKITSVEGVTEYQLPNGLRAVLIPDPSIDTFTVNITYLVGSRHESYGEKGMAHLLEHLLFKGSPRFPDIKAEFMRRGARWNGTTSYDRTNYFETLPATGDNLAFALAAEADRMVNAWVRKADLDSEMTVVRNEFESGQNSPGNVLHQRISQALFSWHNYGNPIIGARSDIENVPIERLRGFYQLWYQPDNAVLLLSGNFDEANALALIEKSFGPIAKPKRALPALYTSEPTQDGERSVTLRRTGDTPFIGVMYRIPAASHPDYPAVDLLVQLLGSSPTGRLHRALVQKGLATGTWGSERPLHDPGFAYFGASLLRDAPIEPVREALFQSLESIASQPIQADELERARIALLGDFEKVRNNSQSLTASLSEFIAMGDWRLFYLYRDRLREATLADVQRVATHYLKPANRVSGVFIPTSTPDRADIPPRADLTQTLNGYKGGAGVVTGEVFDPSPSNIESRVQRSTLNNGIQVALLPKRTRGQTVVAYLSLNWGDEASRNHRSVACGMASGLLIRGTQRRTRAQLQEAFEQLNASVSLGIENSSVEVKRDQLAATLELMVEALRQPAFDATEFEELRRAAIASAQSQRTDPATIASTALQLHLSPYPPGHWFATQDADARIAALQAVTLDQVRDCHASLVGATGAQFSAVGDFDAQALRDQLNTLLGDWIRPAPYQRLNAQFFDVTTVRQLVRTPDKANAVLRAGINIPMRDDHQDFTALVLGNYLLGGTSSGRLPTRIREKEGLSYSTYSSFSAQALDAVASFGISAIFAPQNLARVEAAMREELVRALRDGFDAKELEAGKRGLIETRKLARAQDRSLAPRLASYLFVGRDFRWDEAFEKRLLSLTAIEVRDALRRHLDPARLSISIAADLKE